jgi:AcrR family transcriptional regulator
VTATRILDADGEGALTFRALAAHLSTGSGAIHWHVADKSDLLATATDGVLARVLTEASTDGEPREALRAFALGLLDAIDAHPWVGTQRRPHPGRHRHRPRGDHRHGAMTRSGAQGAPSSGVLIAIPVRLTRGSRRSRSRRPARP